MSVGDCKGARRRMKTRYGITSGVRRKSIQEAIEFERLRGERQAAAKRKKKKEDKKR